MRVLAMKVGWNIGWTNLPGLHMLLDEPPPTANVWRLIPVERGNFLLCRQEPVVRFFFESEHGGGALGRKVELEDGSEYTTNGGWSSNEGQINHLRATDTRFAEYLPEDVIGISTYGEYARPDTYNDGWGLGMAGYTFDVSWVRAQIAEHLPGVELLDVTDRSASASLEERGNAEQAFIIGSGSAYGYLPVPAPWDGFTLKAKPGTELFERTAMAWDRKHALTTE